MTAKEILAKVVAVFNAPIAPAVPVAPVAAAEPAPVVPVGKPYKTKDGVELSIVQAGEIIGMGDTVTIAGAPATEGEYELEDGSKVTVDAAGAVTAFAPAEPVTTDLSTVPAVPAIPAPVVPIAAAEHTPEQFPAMVASFATGTPEERIANLERVAKALMENCFGWQLREAEQKAAADQAIAIYKNGLTTANATMAKHEETIKGLFELVEKLVELPTVNPVTLTGNKKEKFDRINAKEEKMQKIADAIGKLKTAK